MFKNLAITLVVLCCAQVFWAQNKTFSIKGVVKESTLSPIPFANVSLTPGELKVVTDVDGRFQFVNLLAGKYTITAEFVGFETATLTVNLKERDEEVVIEMTGPTPGLLYTVYPRVVNVESTRATATTPMAYSETTAEQLKVLNNGQDLPMLLRFTPSLISTSDAGNGVGYTGLWIRGSDQTRVNVTINDIPINDPESQQVFWVNMPDLASSANNIQVQRGVGTSTNGAAAFGGAIKIRTTDLKASPYAEVNNSYGSFNTFKNTVSAGTGLIEDKYAVDVRLSNITSDGYIDRATSDLKSFFTSVARYGAGSALKLTVFGGKERTYQSWYGTPSSRITGNRDSMLVHAINNGLTEAQTENLLNSGRTYNFYTYPNQVDDYRQTHYQLHYAKYAGKFTLNLAGHYTRGGGFYEEFREQDRYSRYGLQNVVVQNDTIERTDLVRRRQLQNHFYGLVGSLHYKTTKSNTTFGFAANEYRGEHYGEFIWMQFAGANAIGDRYYQGNSVKRDGNAYVRTTYSITQRVEAYADVQVRNVVYNTSGVDNDLRAYDVTDHLVFFNPKAGLMWNKSDKERVFASFAVGNKEPNRNDYIDAPSGVTPKHETLYDLEAGYRFTEKQWNIGFTVYNMQYRNQLVLTGALNDVGAPIRTNVDRSYRRGIETEFAAHIKWMHVNGNITLSQNRIQRFKESIFDYDAEAILEIEHRNKTISFSPALSGAAMVQADIWSAKNGTETEQLFCVRWFTKYVGKQYLDNTQNDHIALDSYLVNDIQLAYEDHRAARTRWGLILSANNVLNSLYSANGYTYSYIYGSRITEVFYYPQAGLNFSVTLNLAF